MLQAQLFLMLIAAPIVCGFSSPEYEVLKVSYWDQSMSGVNNLLYMTKQVNGYDFAYNTGPLLTKLFWNLPWMTLHKKS